MPSLQNAAQRAVLVARGLPWRRASGGLGIALIALVALAGTAGLEFGTVEHPGPAAVPVILAAILFVLGIVVAIEELLKGAPARASGERQ
jgi:peptidoglycan/LPS O-acetylase OafA/YrhL